MTNPREKFNPEKKPLEELTILVGDDGVQKKIPALSSHFAGDRPMVSFFVPPAMNESGSFPIGAKGEWFHKMEIFTANLQWLLALPHHRFWSQIVYGKKTWDSIISFLQEAYPFFAIHNLPNDTEINQRYNEISHLVFCVICRATTQIESEDAWIGKAKFSDLLYNNTIISLPILFDICVVFGNHNKDEVNHIISNIFSIQPLYKDDLDSSVQHLKNVLSTIEERFSMSVVKVDVTLDSNRKMSISELYDITFYVLDIAATLFSFIDAYPEGAMILHLHRFEVTLAQFYEKVFPTVIKFMQELFGEKSAPYESLLFTVNQARIYFIKLFYLVIESSLNVIIENRTTFPEELLKYNTESFLNVIKESLASKIFIVDYEKMYPLEQDLSILSQVALDANKAECDSVLELLRANSICANNTRPEIVIDRKLENGLSFEEKKSGTVISNGINLSDVEKDSLITEVKDILPHLGEGFIMKCLEHYKFKSSDVINGVLENLLPPSLQELDHALPIIPPEPGTSGKPDVIAHRVNIFDNDEFDVMSRDYVDTSRIHKGKRKDAKDVQEILDDKSFREELRTKFSELGIVETFDNVYEDEYDDTYDDIVDPIEQEGEDERKFVTPRVLQQLERYTKGNQNEEESGEDEEAEPVNANHRDRKFVPFVENPEDVRRRREAKYHRGGFNQQRNVVGQAKGQGQEADVLKNRHKKNVHKSSQGNHNRKKGAQFKRSQGFIPS